MAGSHSLSNLPQDATLVGLWPDRLMIETRTAILPGTIMTFTLVLEGNRLCLGLSLSTWLFFREQQARRHAISAEQAQRQLRQEAEANAKRAGMVACASFIFGAPPETEADAKETLDFIKQTRPHVVQVNAVPGTSLPEMMRMGRLLTKDLFERVRVRGRPIIETIEQQAGRELAAVARAAMPDALNFSPRLISSDFAPTLNLFQQAVTDILRGEATPAEAMVEAQRKAKP
jgi:hypothetical protein